MWKREERSKTLSIDNRECKKLILWILKNYLMSQLFAILADSFVGPVLTLPFITQSQSGAYLCIASVNNI